MFKTALNERLTNVSLVDDYAFGKNTITRAEFIAKKQVLSVAAASREVQKARYILSSMTANQVLYLVFICIYFIILTILVFICKLLFLIVYKNDVTL